MRRLPALALSLLAGSLACGAALGFGRGVRARALRSSHEQERADPWLESARPTSADLVSRGRRLFLGSCAHCHGADATGDEGPDLHDLPVSDRYIAHLITFGEPHEMPAFAKKHGPADVRALVAYVRSLEP